MSDDNIILGIVAAIGLMAFSFLPTPILYGYMGCDDNGNIVVRNIYFGEIKGLKGGNFTLEGSCK